MSYELLENDLTHSTLWMLCSKDAKLLFVTILAECRGHDTVRTPLPVLYRLAGLTADEGTAALAELTRPDPASKYQGEEGRRIVQVEDEDGRALWLPSYRSRRNRYLTRQRKAAQRDRERSEERGEGVTQSHAASRSVTQGHDASPAVTQGHTKFASESEAESEAEAEKRGEREKRRRFAPPSLDEVRAYGKDSLPGLNAEAFLDFYESKGWKVGNQPMKDWKAAARRWLRSDVEAGKVSPRSVEAKSRAMDEADREAEAQRLAEIEIREVERIRREGGF